VLLRLSSLLQTRGFDVRMQVGDGEKDNEDGQKSGGVKDISRLGGDGCVCRGRAVGRPVIVECDYLCACVWTASLVFLECEPLRHGCVDVL